MSIKLNDTQLVMLSAAAQPNDRCLTPPPSLREAQLAKTGQKLIAAGFVRELKAKPSAPVWRRDSEGGSTFALKLTAAGAKAIALEDEPGAEERLGHKDDAASDQTPSAAQPSIANEATTVARPSTGPRPETTLYSPTAAPTPSEPRPNSKIAAVIGLMTRPDGATLAELVAATNWLPHTTRAALTGLRKRGYLVGLDRSNRQRGSAYCIESTLARVENEPPPNGAEAA